MAADMIGSRRLRHVLVVTSDRGQDPGRLMGGMVSVFGDGAASCLLSADSDDGFLIEGSALHCSPDMADVDMSKNLIASLKGSMNGASAAVRACLTSTGLAAERFHSLITGNFNHSVLKTFSAQLGFPLERVFSANVGRFGHCFAADTLVSLQTLVDRQALTPGDRCLLLGTGNNTWGAIAVRMAPAGSD
jgi:3-oxoacyl-[acyl-carrier-protein] synthase-3